MSDQEFSAMIFLLGYGAVFMVAARILGIRTVLWAIGLVIFFAVLVAFKTLIAVAGVRRY